jgi:hypothetical protein
VASSVRAWVAVAALPLGLLAGCTSGPAGRALECPAAPFQHRVTSGDLERDPLRGPALGDVSHGVYVHRLALDGAALVVRPPRAHDRAGYPGGEALCEVMASQTTNNFTIGRQSPDTVAAGLARVTVDPSVPSLRRQMYGVAPKGPPAARYRDRLAWVVVVSPAVRSNGSAFTCTPLSARERASRHNYLVFVVDAQTGGDALLYTERGYGVACANMRRGGPYVDVPMTSASVPWRLVAFAPRRNFARIAVDVTACDDGPPYVWTDHGSDPARVRVVVSRPFGAPCGPAKTVVVTARPEAVNGTFSATLAHAQVGPYFDG